jgi:thiazole synthase
MSTDTNLLVIGGGVIGLAIALELQLRGATVTLLSRDVQQAATQAAAGMLAPYAEDIAPSPLLDLCLKSRALYPEWISKIEDISGLDAGYWACGILAPRYDTDRFQKEHPVSSDSRIWLNQAAIHHAQPGLSKDVIGGWWFPEDGQVDNRALANALTAAVVARGVTIQTGITVINIEQQQGHVVGVKTTAGEWRADHYVLATGAWTPDLLPLPVQPQKGQMLSVAAPLTGDRGLPLQRILYGEDIYIVPRRDGRILLGATVESVGFTPSNTPAGLRSLLNAAIRLYPGLQDLPIQESWWGFRPATPDKMPILGGSQCDNLTLAVGHDRNGILLAPVTALLIADWVAQQPADLISHFTWERFLQPGVLKANVAKLLLPQNGSTHVQPHSTHPSVIQIIEPLKNSFNPTVQTLDSVTLQSQQPIVDQPLAIAGRTFQSRLMTGTGKYRNFDDMRRTIAASGSQIVTVAVRRVQTNAPGHEGLADALDWSTLWMLPNTAGCQTAEEAIRVARLGREMAKLLGQEDNNFVKLEVIPDAKYLLPDPIGTLQAAEQLVKEGFAVLPYINADPLLAKRLEEIGCATVMPLGSPIGSGQGIRNAANIQIIIETAKVPVVVDAGIGTPSEAAQAMEMGADALLINTAIAQAQNSILMGQAMGMATQAGRLAYQAGRIPIKAYASASSPLTGTITANS